MVEFIKISISLVHSKQSAFLGEVKGTLVKEFGITKPSY